MRMSDWSADVCSSDLILRPVADEDRDVSCLERLRHLLPLQRHLFVHLAGDAPVGRKIDEHRLFLGPERRQPPLAERLGLQGTLGMGDSGRMGARHKHHGRKTGGGGGRERSEEHTSELQSLMRISYAVFCLTKKKKNTQTTNIHNT